MGRCYAFECTRCGYIARVAGGEDGGAHCFTRTIHCLDCHALFDVVTHVRCRGLVPRAGHRLGTLGAARVQPAYPLPAHAAFSGIVLQASCLLPDRLLPEGRRTRWTEFRVHCPNQSAHRVVGWSHPGPCPHCQSCLERTVIPSLIWE